MKRHHKILLGGASTIIIVALVVIALLLNAVVIKQNSDNAALNAKLSALANSTNAKINELAGGLISTRQDLNIQLNNINQTVSSTNTEISKLKVQTGGDFSGVIKDSMKSIVIIKTISDLGSGFFIANGYIVTNEHVIENNNGGIAQNIQVITSDGKSHTASIVGYIKNLDIALIKTDTGYGTLKLVNSGNVTIGEKVVAIGTPEGLSFSATDGIVSAVNRTGFGTDGTYVQTNAQLNPGNSGGPLIDQNGNVVGMNNFKFTNTEGLGFALEANKIKLGVNTISQKILNETLIN